MERPQIEQRFDRRHRSNISLRIARALLGTALLIGPAPIYAAHFEAKLDRDTLALGESVTLSLTFEGGSPKDVPAPPAIPSLQINYVGPSSQFSVINGQVTSTVTYNFTLTPRRVGEFIIPALNASIGGEKLSTNPLKLNVLKPGAPPPEAINSGSEPAFLKLLLPRKEIYLGEVIVAELQLYYRQDAQLAAQPQLTGLPVEGFTAGKITSGSQRQAQIGNTRYTVIPVAIALTSLKTGPLSIGPITLSIVLELPSNNRRRDPFFEQFGIRSPFDSGEQKQLSLATDKETVQSLPLPANNVPPGFNGAIGNYTLTATAGPTNLTVGDPITVRVQISGRGALDALALPEQDAWHDFKTYPPTSKIATTDALGLQGTKTFEQIVTPQTTDVRELPAFAFSFFDPDQKTYRTLTQPSVQLAVRPGRATPAPAILAMKPAAPDHPAPQQDIVPIKQRPGTVAQIGPPLAMQPWFLAAQSVPIFAWLAAFVWRKRTDTLASNPRLRRQRQIAQLIRDGQKDLHRFAAGNKADEFFASLFHLLQEQLGERLDCPATSITEAVIEERLKPAGVPDKTLAALHDLFQSCNLARYAPITGSQEMSAIIPRFETVVCELQRLDL